RNSIVDTTVTVMVSGLNAPAESCAISVTRPAASPHTSTDVDATPAGIWVRLRLPPGHPAAGRATPESLDDRNTATGLGSVRLSVNGPDTLPPLPTASES